MNTTITLVISEEGHLSIIMGGEIAPARGAQICLAAANWFQEQAIEAEVQRRVEEATKEQA